MIDRTAGSRRRWAGRIVLILVAITGAVVVMKSPLRELMEPAALRETLTGLRQTAQAHWYGPLLFMLSYIVGATFFVPATLFILAAAFLWGWMIGGLYALAAAIICAGLSFELSRYVFGRLAERLFAERLPWLHRMFDGAGIRSVMLLRLVPGIPFPVFNFGAGLTSLRSRDYMIGSTIGLTLPTFVIAFSADAIFSGTLDRGAVAGRLGIAAVLLAVLVIVPPLIAKRMHLRAAGTEPLPADRDQPPSMVN